MHGRIYADVIGSKQLEKPETLLPALGDAVRSLNQLFAPGIAAPFVVAYDDALHGALADAVQAPLCVSVLRELLAPLQVRVGRGRRGLGRRRLRRRLARGPSGALQRRPARQATCCSTPSAAWSTRSCAARSDTEWEAVRTVRRHETRSAAATELEDRRARARGASRGGPLARGRGRRRHDRGLPGSGRHRSGPTGDADSAGPAGGAQTSGSRRSRRPGRRASRGRAAGRRGSPRTAPCRPPGCRGS